MFGPHLSLKHPVPLLELEVRRPGVARSRVDPVVERQDHGLARARVGLRRGPVGLPVAPAQVLDAGGAGIGLDGIDGPAHAVFVPLTVTLTKLFGSEIATPLASVICHLTGTAWPALAEFTGAEDVGLFTGWKNPLNLYWTL